MNQNLSAPLEYFEKNKSQFLNELIQLARIPSVSFDGFPKETVMQSAQAVADLFRKTKLENVQILKLSEDVHPYVYADWLHAPGMPTVLLYAHHDVQPAGRLEVWKTDPFEPVEKNGRLYGRGTADDKAGIMVHTAAIASYLETFGKLPVNVKLIIEGEEEIGSTHLASFVAKYKDLLKADAMVLTDTQNYDSGLPTLTVSLRGLVVIDVEVKALNSPKHSGMWGGPIPDPTVALCKMLASLTDTEGRIQVEGVWDDVRKLSAEEEKLYAKLPLDLAELRHQAGLLPSCRFLNSRDGTVQPLIQMWREPALSINAIQASSRKNRANIINDSAWARVGVRIVPDMCPEKIARLVEEHLRRVTPWGLEVKFTHEAATKAWGTKAEGPYFDAGMRALEKGYGKKTVIMGSGGTIPFVEPLSEQLGGIPALLIGVEDPYSNPHSENESMLISDFEKSIKSSIYFFDEVSRLKNI